MGDFQRQTFLNAVMPPPPKRPAPDMPSRLRTSLAAIVFGCLGILLIALVLVGAIPDGWIAFAAVMLGLALLLVAIVLAYRVVEPPLDDDDYSGDA